MIKVENGKLEMKGNPIDLCTDATVVVRGLLDAFEKNDVPKEIAVDMVKKSVDLAFKTREELRKEAEEKIGKLVMRLFDEFLEDEEEGEETNE